MSKTTFKFSSATPSSNSAATLYSPVCTSVLSWLPFHVLSDNQQSFAASKYVFINQKQNTSTFFLVPYTLPCAASPNPCQCQPGYAQCGPGICCLRYKNMARRYAKFSTENSTQEANLNAEKTNGTQVVDNTQNQLNKKEEGVETTKVNLSEGSEPQTMVLKVYKKNETVSFLRNL